MGQIVYTYEKCREEALKYKTRFELKKNNRNVLMPFIVINGITLFSHI